MAQPNADTIRQVVEEVLAALGKAPKSQAKPVDGDWGVFQSVDQAVAAATEGFHALSKAPLASRTTAVQLVKEICERDAVELGTKELEETKIGRLDHKIEKLQILKLVPGVEFLKTNAMTGSNGVCLEEFAP
ncbi:MAG TPA: aldehyde dehydrogenase EutE, partial [Planctomycetaceae bacterium]|nr:aldehyde dehydrogenase EutE [Planctomycetaceae bacterium]